MPRHSWALSSILPMRSRRSSQKQKQCFHEERTESLKIFTEEGEQGRIVSAATTPRTTRPLRVFSTTPGILDKPLPKRPIQRISHHSQHRRRGMPSPGHQLVSGGSKNMLLQVRDSHITHTRAQPNPTVLKAPPNQPTCFATIGLENKELPQRPPRPSIFLKDVLSLPPPVADAVPDRAISRVETGPTDALLTNLLISLQHHASSSLGVHRPAVLHLAARETAFPGKDSRR
ncbi:uncharacterized protein EI97DRAFT_434178 [Westerdykella ornata]|uniref:Uncharacterized protein n=1 Tax=Westerdykella ornata TaxID=318751 RepID=A0A6A6JK99_WESOR|nr:uncharacterized protein EI97DRAFT_434178 [Westerdykella ornata]KAF2275309.1 hypothetical protein EI97DRAFT_434178 [Westerdykella ornata]